MRALHLTAMGRVNAPEQQRLCEALAEMFEHVFAMQPDLPVEAKIASVLSVQVEPPKRRKKAE